MPSASSQTPTASVADPASGFNSAASTETTLTEALVVLRKRKWIIIAGILIGLFYGIWSAATQPILYTSVGRIEVRSATANEYKVSASAGSALMGNNLEGEVMIILSDTLLLNVAREMNLANNPEFLGYKPAVYQDINQPSIRYAILGLMQNAVHANLMLKTDIIRIVCVTNKPQLAADIVNHVINAYIQRSYETRFASTQRVSQWLSSQLDDLKQQVERSQQRVIDLQKKLGVVGLGAGDRNGNLLTQSSAGVDALLTASSAAKVQRILAESRYRTLRSSDPNLLESSLDASGIPNSELSRLRTDATETKAQIAQLSVQLGPKNPQILALQAHLREVEREVKDEQTRLMTQAEQAYNAARANEQQTLEALNEQKNDSYKMRDDMVELTLLQRDYDANRALYESLLSRLRAATVQAGLESMEVDVVDQATPPATVTITPRSSILFKTCIFGFIGGIVVAFLLESLDTGLRSIAEVEQVTGLPSLSVIPRIRRLSDTGGNMSVAQSNIGVLATSKSQFAEAFRSLRTSLLLATTGHPPKIILVSSSTPTEGKTTVATNLACIMAQRETRVILIDADLRRPNVHHRFGLNGRVGLSTVLSGGSSLEEAVRSVPEVPNLDVLCSGPVPPFPTEMLSSQAMHELLQRCAGIYTHVVIDSPPILSVTDGVILARAADAVILVIRHGKSTRNVVRRSRDLLVRAGANMTGVVLNSVDITAPEYHGYYGYSGYSYSNIDSETWETQAPPKTDYSETKEGQ